MKKNKQNGFFTKLILILNIAAVATLLLSYLAGIISPVKYWYIAFFGLAYPFVILANVIFLVVWIFKKRWYFLISLTAILIGYNTLLSTFGFRTKTEHAFIKDSAAISLMTYNVHHFKQFGFDLDSSTRQNILGLIANEQPDVLGLQEFFTRHKGKYLTKDSIFNILGSKEYYFFPNSGNDYESTGIALFTKLPIVAQGNLEKLDPGGANNGIWVDLKKDDKIFRVYLVHLASISFMPEDYSYFNQLKSDFSTKDNDVEKGKRILYRLRNAFIKRAKQVEILKNYTDTCKTPYIIMGDFNDTPAAYSVKQISKNMQNAFREKGSGLGITYNGEFPNFQIDYILASRKFDILSYKIIKKAYSDHYPVKAEVKLQAEN